VEDDGKYYVLPYFWLPEETLKLRVRRDHVPYDVWKQQQILVSILIRGLENPTRCMKTYRGVMGSVFPVISGLLLNQMWKVWIPSR
jgi:hypothetical protein